jgi:hypothetical protein
VHEYIFPDRSDDVKLQEYQVKRMFLPDCNSLSPLYSRQYNPYGVAIKRRVIKFFIFITKVVIGGIGLQLITNDILADV